MVRTPFVLGQTRGHDQTLWSPNHSKRLGTSNEIINSKTIALPRIAQPWFRRLEVQYRVTWWQANVTHPISPFNVDIHIYTCNWKRYTVFSTQSTLQHVQSVQLICDQRRVLKVQVRTYMYMYMHVLYTPTVTACTSIIRKDMYEYSVRILASSAMTDFYEYHQHWRVRVLREYPSCSARSHVMTTVTCSIQSSCPAGCRVGARSSKTIRYNLQVGIRNKQNKTIILRQNCV